MAEVVETRQVSCSFSYNLLLPLRDLSSHAHIHTYT